ncbi:hypothetical protein JW935_06180 [candidate division KSB1 bacterium]|nr:hypothetical protein [candidate division KSB1 bacterium]
MNKVAIRIELEISQIDQLLESYAKILEKAQEEELDLIEITALGSVLHSFYNGLENIFFMYRN